MSYNEGGGGRGGQGGDRGGGGGKSGASHVRFYPISFPYALHDARVLPATCFARCAASISVVRWLGFKLRSLLPQSSPPVARLM